jgi:hypothetical protein
MWAAAHHNVYDFWAPLLKTLGLYPLPIIPGTKCPGEYIGQGQYRKLSGWNTLPPLRSTQPGAGIALRLGDGLVGLDIDTDDADFLLRIQAKYIPPGRETISRIGQRGELFFLRVPPGVRVESRKFPLNGGMVGEIIGTGAKCVLPPTMHPDINRPYRWGANGCTFFNTDIATLPEWPV